MIATTDRPNIIVALASGGFQHLWKFCLESQSEYAARFGYEQHILEENPWPEMTPHWAKFQHCLNLVRAGHNVLLIDADILVRGTAPRFETLLEAHPGKDIFAAMGSSNRPNSGYIVFRGGEKSLAGDFLETCLAGRDKEIPVEDRVTAYGENGHFIYYLKQAPFDGTFEVIPPEWNATSLATARTGFNIHYTAELRSGDGLFDRCIPFWAAGHREDFAADKAAKRAHFYFQRRPYFRRLLRRSAFARTLTNRYAQKVGGSLPDEGEGNSPAERTLLNLERATRMQAEPTVRLIQRLLEKDDVIVASSDLAGRLADSGKRTWLPIDAAAVVDENAGSIDKLAQDRNLKAIDLLLLADPVTPAAALKSAAGLLADGKIRMAILSVDPRASSVRYDALGPTATALANAGLVARQIRNDYVLGPRGFIDRGRPAFYLAAPDSVWPYIEARLTAL